MSVTSRTADHCSSDISTIFVVPPKPGVVHRDVDLPVFVHYRVVEAPHVLLDGDVAAQGHRTAPVPGDLGQTIGCLAETALVGVRDDDGRPFAEAAFRGRETDSGSRCRCDHDDLAVEQPVAGRWSRRCRWVFWFCQRVPFGSGGRPRTRSATMFRWISFDPP